MVLVYAKSYTNPQELLTKSVFRDLEIVAHVVIKGVCMLYLHCNMLFVMRLNNPVSVAPRY